MSEQLDLFAEDFGTVEENVVEVAGIEEVEEVVETVQEVKEVPVIETVTEEPIKIRSANMSKRGIYIQDKELLETLLQVGTFFKYETYEESKTVIVLPSDVKGRHTVSKRKMGDILKPVIDIRQKSVLAIFDGCDKLEIRIYVDRIEVIGKNENEKAGNE